MVLGRLPAPVVPTFSYFSDLVPDIFVIAIITFAINAGLVKTYAAEFGYDVLVNQFNDVRATLLDVAKSELLALGISNTFGSFFQCHTASGALSRTAVVVTIGMASQAVLGCIVCVALTSTFKKVLDLRRLWKVSKTDASFAWLPESEIGWSRRWLVSVLPSRKVGIDVRRIFYLDAHVWRWSRAAVGASSLMLEATFGGVI
ncbi:unnamed protein product [Hydatigera taeniaeformis]|uniref:SLC26A/SulP transporter domain-containing protein n=1 Tax=Hydatigena taeniaeformis TaxID=6205 RepID=A0A3P7G403_HYDTA|nr:unnamed protein product [Hydatigera taeniaeformis]